MISQVNKELWIIHGGPFEAGRGYELRWQSIISRENIGTPAQRRSLIAASQDFLWSVVGPDRISGGELSPGTAFARFKMIGQFCRWVSSQNIWSYSDLSPNDLLGFFSQIQSVKGRGKSVPAHATVRRWVSFFSEMWLLRHRCSQPLSVNVTELKSEILTRVETRRDKVWNSLEEDAALALIREALAWLTDHGEAVLAIARKGRDASSRMTLANESSKPYQIKQRGSRRRTRCKSARRISKEYVDEVAATEGFRSLQSEIVPSGNLYHDIAHVISVTEGACAFLLLVLVGFRSGELLNLNRNCLVEDVGGDGVSMTYIQGAAAKKRGALRRWVAGDPIPRVIRFLARLSSDNDEQLHDDGALFVARAPGASHFMPREGSQIRLDWSRIQLRISHFAMSGTRSQGTIVRRLHPHMLRKTFAQLAVMRDKSRLEAVAVQLGHAYQEFTDRVYVRPDFELHKLIGEQDRKELSLGLQQILAAPRLGGKGAEALAGLRLQAGGFRGKKALTKMVDDLVQMGVQLAPCDWGYCVYSKALSSCSGDDRGPNPVYREPTVCANCSNFVVTEKHRLWWDERARECEAFLRREGLPKQTRLIVEARYQSSLKVLSGLVRRPRKVEKSGTD